MDITNKIVSGITAGIAALALTACEDKIEKCYDVSEYAKVPCRVCFMADKNEEPIYFRTGADQIMPLPKYGNSFYNQIAECRTKPLPTK